jgi:hypothetical protein
MVLIVASTAGANFMSKIWSQKYPATAEYGNPATAKRVLIATVSSGFKDSCISGVIDSLRKDSVFVKVLGLKEVTQEDPAKWNVVVLVSTTMAMDIDNRTSNFIKRHNTYHDFVVVTTSANPRGWGTGKNLVPAIDAISSASAGIGKQPEMIAKIVASIRRHIGNGKLRIAPPCP